MEIQPIDIHYPRFISNNPNGVDMFEGRSQERLAKAIAEHIKDTDCDKDKKPVVSRLIGLEGNWGCGKSNVIKILEKNYLKESYIFFTFDAWCNQEDLQRRSILELMTQYLINKKKLTGETSIRVMKPEGDGKVEYIPCTWSEKLDSLLSRKSYTRNITVPSINNWTKVFALMLLVTGLIIPTLDLVAKGSLCWWAHLLIILFPMLLFLIIASIAKKIGPMWKMYNTDGKSDTTSFVISEQEPSFREFKDWMTEVSNGLSNGDKLIIVFDNMDRLPSDKVRQFWSLIQTFFADEGYSNIWCIVPYDESHLSEVFAENEGKGTVLLKGFLSKTFPVVYRVPEPIVSDYKNIFDTLYRDAFGATVCDEDIELISQCYRLIHTEPNVRDIITFVNNNVLLAKQWDTAIKPISRAVYVLKAEDILSAPNITNFVKGDIREKAVSTDEYILANEFFSDFKIILTGNVDLNTMRREIAALVYGVETKDADQIVVRRYIRNSISGKTNDAKLSNYTDNPHFMLLLSEDVYSMEVTDYERAAALIDEIDSNKLTDPDKKKLTGIWNFFSRKYADSNILIKEYSDYEHIVFNHATYELAKKCASSFCRRLITNNEVNGSQLFEQLTKLFNDDFAKAYNIQDICPAISIDAERFASYVLKAGKDYTRFPITTDGHQLNLILERSIDTTFPYLEVLKILKDDGNFKMEEVGAFATEQLNQQRANAKTASNLIAVQRVFHDKFQSTLDNNYISTLWQEIRLEEGHPAYDEIYTLKTINSYDQLPDDESHVDILMPRALFYTTTHQLFVDCLSHYTSIRKKLLKKMVEERIHDIEPDYPDFIEHWQDIVNNLGIDRSTLVRFADDWGYKHISIEEKGKSFFTLLSDSGWIDTLLNENTSVATELLKKCATELITQPQNQFVQSNTVNRTTTPWSKALEKLINTDYISGNNLGTLEDLAVYLLDYAAKNRPFQDDIWNLLLRKVEYINISSSITDLRNNILNGQSGYVMTPDKFKMLHIWLEQSEINTEDHCSDAANQILAKVIDDRECQAIILENKEYYSPIISKTVNTASALHAKLKSILEVQHDTEFAGYVKTLVRYDDKTGE